MKKNIIKCLLGFSAMVMLNSCDKTEGALYSGEPNKISFYGPTTSIAMTGGKISVPVGRTSSAGDLSVPLTLTATGANYTNVFSLEGPVTFADGASKGYAIVKYGDFSSIDPSTLSVTASGTDVKVGLAFPISLTIPNANASVSNVKKVDILASSALEFEDKGTVRLDSRLGWQEADMTVKIQKAKGVNVYKLVNPFGATSNSIAFMIKSDGKTIVFPNQVLFSSYSTYGALSMTGVTGTVANNVVTLKVTAYSVAAGSFGAGTEVIYLP